MPAGGGTLTAFSSGDCLSQREANFLYGESGERIGPGHRTPAGSYPANPFGFYDMHGNVCEWVADDWHTDYRGAPADGTPWINQGRAAGKVLRGGAWDYLPRLLRSSWRDCAPDDTRRDNLGFRVAADIL